MIVNIKGKIILNLSDIKIIIFIDINEQLSINIINDARFNKIQH